MSYIHGKAIASDPATARANLSISARHVSDDKPVMGGMLLTKHFHGAHCPVCVRRAYPFRLWGGAQLGRNVHGLRLGRPRTPLQDAAERGDFDGDAQVPVVQLETA